MKGKGALHRSSQAGECLMTHTYICRFCERFIKIFRQMNSLRDHVIAIIGWAKVFCRVCFKVLISENVVPHKQRKNSSLASKRMASTITAGLLFKNKPTKN